MAKLSHAVVSFGCVLLAACGGGGSESGSGSGGATDVSNPGPAIAGVYRGRMRSFTLGNRFKVLSANLTVAIESDATVNVTWRPHKGELRLRGRMVGASEFTTSVRQSRVFWPAASETCDFVFVVNGRHENGAIDGAAFVRLNCDSGRYEGSRGFVATRSSQARATGGAGFMPSTQSPFDLFAHVID